MGKYPLFSEFLELMVVAEHIFGVLYCNPLSLTTFSGIPNLANIFIDSSSLSSVSTITLCPYTCVKLLHS